MKTSTTTPKTLQLESIHASKTIWIWYHQARQLNNLSAKEMEGFEFTVVNNNEKTTWRLNSKCKPLLRKLELKSCPSIYIEYSTLKLYENEGHRPDKYATLKVSGIRTDVSEIIERVDNNKY